MSMSNGVTVNVHFAVLDPYWYTCCSYALWKPHKYMKFYLSTILIILSAGFDYITVSYVVWILEFVHIKLYYHNSYGPVLGTKDLQILFSVFSPTYLQLSSYGLNITVKREI